MVCNDTEVTYDVLYFLAFKETGATTHGVWYIVFKKCFFYCATLGVCPHQNSEIVVVSFFLSRNAQQCIRDEVCLRSLIFRHVDFYRSAFSVSTPQFFVLAVCVVLYDTVCCR